MPWLWTFAVFTIFRLLAFLFFAIVNDLIFAYNILMVLVWSVICVGSVYGWILIYSLYLELADLTKLEDLAHLRVGIFMVFFFYFDFLLLYFSPIGHPDGYNGFAERIDNAFAGRFPSNNAAQYRIDDARLTNKTKRFWKNIPSIFIYTETNFNFVT